MVAKLGGFLEGRELGEDFWSVGKGFLECRPVAEGSCAYIAVPRPEVVDSWSVQMLVGSCEDNWSVHLLDGSLVRIASPVA